MATYKKTNFIGGAWTDKSKLTEGMRAKLVSETNPQPSQFKDTKGNEQTQDVAKVQFEGLGEATNMNLNQTTINGLVDAFGEESAKWQGHYLTVHIETNRIGGVKRTTVYLIPEGYEMKDDANGYAIIVKKGTAVESEPATGEAPDEVPVIDLDKDELIDDGIKSEDIPF